MNKQNHDEINDRLARELMKLNEEQAKQVEQAKQPEVQHMASEDTEGGDAC